MRTLINIFIIIAFACIGFAVYSNTFQCSFHLDDINWIVSNFSIRDIHNVSGIWKAEPARFITYLSFALNYHFGRLNVFGYHAVNLFIHICSALAVWRLASLLFRTPAMRDKEIAGHADILSFFSGIIFLTHPLQTQAVTYLIQRTASLGTLLYVCSLCFYIAWRLEAVSSASGKRRTFLYAAAIIAAMLGIFSKENVVTLPFIMLCFEIFFMKGEKPKYRPLMPFFVIALFSPIALCLSRSELFVSAITTWTSDKAPEGMTSIQYFMTQIRVMVTYMRLLILPVNQNVDYSYPIIKTIFSAPLWYSGLLLLIVSYITFRLYASYRMLSFAVCWFFIVLIPESSFVPIRDVIFEHRLYLPMVGFSIFLVTALYYCVNKIHPYFTAKQYCKACITKGIVSVSNTLRDSTCSTVKNCALPAPLYGDEAAVAVTRRYKHNSLLFLVALLVVVNTYSILTYRRNFVWSDEVTLWSDAIKKSPDKSRPYNNRGLGIYPKGNIDQAIADFSKAIELDPKNTEAYSNRSMAYSSKGNIAQAIADSEKALELDPKMLGVYINLGNAYTAAGDFKKAIEACEKGLAINPSCWELYNCMGFVYELKGDFDAAFQSFGKAIELNPEYAAVYSNRGNVCQDKKEYDKAILDYNKAIELNPRFVAAYHNRGNAYAAKGNAEWALNDYNSAIELDLSFADAYFNRGRLLSAAGNTDGAIADFTRALSVNPNYANAYLARGAAYQNKGHLDFAIADYIIALKINPNLAAARENLARAKSLQEQ